MTAVEHVGERPADGGARLLELVEGRSARAVADALMPADREKFLAEYDGLVEQARITLDLEPVFDLVRRWRGLAALQLDPQQYLEHLQRTVELVTGMPVTGAESIDQLREKIGA